MSILYYNGQTKIEKLICGSELANGDFCKNPPVEGGSYCRLHGGKGAKLLDNYTYRHGKYSNYLRKDLLRAYLDAIASPDLYSMSDEIGLLDARMVMLVQQTTSGDTQQLMNSLWEVQGLVKGLVNGKEVDIKDLVTHIDHAISEASAERRRWEEIYSVIESRRKLVESERKRELDAQRMISEKEALGMLALILNLVRKYVDDQKVVEKIGAELTRIAAPTPGGIFS